MHYVHLANAGCLRHSQHFPACWGLVWPIDTCSAAAAVAGGSVGRMSRVSSWYSGTGCLGSG